VGSGTCRSGGALHVSTRLVARDFGLLSTLHIHPSCTSMSMLRLSSLAARAAPAWVRTLRTSAPRGSGSGSAAAAESQPEDPLLLAIRGKMKEAMRARNKGEADVWRVSDAGRERENGAWMGRMRGRKRRQSAQPGPRQVRSKRERERGREHACGLREETFALWQEAAMHDALSSLCHCVPIRRQWLKLPPLPFWGGAQSIIGAYNQSQHLPSPQPLSRLLLSAYDQRITSAATYRAATPAPRIDLAEAEEAEAQLLRPLLPKLLADEELKQEVARAVQQSEGKRMGEVMKILKERLPAEDGKRVAGFVKEALKA
jgi:uncharacterized protein YqeY